MFNGMHLHEHPSPGACVATGTRLSSGTCTASTSHSLELKVVLINSFTKAFPKTYEAWHH